MAEEYFIEDSVRKVINDQESIFGEDIVEQLAEIITNSDDSYSVIEETEPTKVEKNIDIYLDRKNSKFTIVDNAEGISKEDLIDIFKKYDSDTNKGNESNSVRGMFGRGATDVLIQSSYEGKDNFLVSFKNNDATILRFLFDKEIGKKKFFCDQLTEEEIKHYRSLYNVKENGTIVSFGTVKRIPNNLADIMPDYYMLRFIFNNKNRNIILHDINTGKEQKLFNDMSYFDSCEVIVEKDIVLNVSDTKLNAKLKLVKNSKKKNNHYILIYDEKKAVYEDTCFGRERDLGMNEIEGRLEITGLTIYAKDLMKNKNERIVTPTRDGFVTTHPFYKELKKQVEKYLIDACAKITSNKEKKEISMRNNKEWNTFFKDINKYFKDTLEIDTGGSGANFKEPPEEGLKFVRTQIPVKVDKPYIIKLLVNPILIPPGSIISIKSDDKCIKIEQKELLFTNSQDEVPFVLVSITGVIPNNEMKEIIAQCGEYKAKLYYTVENEDVHQPAYGFDFHPNMLTKKPDVERKATMYVNIDKFPLGSIITINNDNQDLKMINEIEVTADLLVSDNIAKVEFAIAGGILNKDYTINASIGMRTVDFKISVRENEDSAQNKNGLINDILVKEAAVDYAQSYFDSDRNIIIVSNNIINSKLLSNYIKTEKLNKDEKYAFYDVVSSQLAQIMLKQKNEKKLIELSNDVEELENIISKEKDIMYRKMLKSIDNE